MANLNVSPTGQLSTQPSQESVSLAPKSPTLSPYNLSSPSAPLQTPFTIAGLKANQPGSVSSSQQNTLAPKNTAPSYNQFAIGGQTTPSSIGTSLGTSNTPPPPVVNTNSAWQNNVIGSSGTQLGVSSGGNLVLIGNGTNSGGTTVPVSPPSSNSSSVTNQPVPSTTPQAPTGPTYPGIVGSLVSTAQGNIPVGQNAANIAAQYGQQIAQVGQEAGQGEAGQLSTGTSPVAMGNAGIIAQNAAAQQAALASGEQAALQGTGQQLTAQNQAQQGLGAAGQLAQPQLGQFGQGYYNPLNPSAGASGGGQYGSGPVAGANVQSIGSLTQQQNNLTTSYNQIQSNTQGLLHVMQEGNINPSSLNIVNGVVQAVAAQTSNPYYQEFANYINDFANRYATILTPAGGNVTNLQTQIAQSLIDASASSSTIQQVINNLNTQAQGVISGIGQTISNIGGTPNTSPQSTQSTQSQSSTASNPFDPANFNL